MSDHDLRKGYTDDAAKKMADIKDHNIPIAPPQDKPDDWLRELLRNVRDTGALDDNLGGGDWRSSDSAIEKAHKAILTHHRKAVELVDRFEVIDDTGRAYVKGNIYGSPVSIELNYQDGGKTLKVFVKDRSAKNGDNEI